jgi:hypothetical protein
VFNILFRNFIRWPCVVFRECQTAMELERVKRDAGRLDKLLMEAIQQKIELSEQLEDWQVWLD